MKTECSYCVLIPLCGRATKVILSRPKNVYLISLKAKDGTGLPPTTIHEVTKKATLLLLLKDYSSQLLFIATNHS